MSHTFSNVRIDEDSYDGSTSRQQFALSVRQNKQRENATSGSGKNDETVFFLTFSQPNRFI